MISDKIVDRIFKTAVANETMLDCFRSIGRGEASSIPRIQIDTNSGWLRIQPGIAPSKDLMGYKAYCVTKGYGPRYSVFLYRISTGELVAIIDADTMTVRRTGALSGVATSYLARKDARTLGVFGSSRQARSMVESILLIRNLDEIVIFSPNKSHRESFSRYISSELGVNANAVAEPREAVAGMDIVGTATGNKTMTPILKGEWFQRGAHINAIGAVGKGRVELNSDSFRRASLIVVDSKDECVQGSQEIIDALQRSLIKEDGIVELSKIIDGSTEGRSSDKQITLFKSQGSGAQDIYAASVIYDMALKEKLGNDIGEIGPALRTS